VNLSVACPTGLYSSPGSDNSSQCRCPQFSTATWKSTTVELCTCNAGYYQLANASDTLGGWQCQVRDNAGWCLLVLVYAQCGLGGVAGIVRALAGCDWHSACPGYIGLGVWSVPVHA